MRVGREDAFSEQPVQKGASRRHVGVIRESRPCQENQCRVSWFEQLGGFGLRGVRREELEGGQYRFFEHFSYSPFGEDPSGAIAYEHLGRPKTVDSGSGVGVI